MIKEDLLHHRERKPFENIKKGIKKMEIRLNDEKRQKIKLNHLIKIVNNEDEKDFLFVKVVGLSQFSSFEKLYNIFNNKINNYEKEILKRVYTKEKENQYGVLVIHFELLK